MEGRINIAMITRSSVHGLRFAIGAVEDVRIFLEDHWFLESTIQ